jgi:hypothetical protein
MNLIRIVMLLDDLVTYFYDFVLMAPMIQRIVEFMLPHIFNNT